MFLDNRRLFFWRQLLKIKYVFHLSTNWVIGDGTRISFWYDSWRGMPLVANNGERPRPPRQKICLKDALPIWDTLAPDFLNYQQVQRVQLNENQDTLLWRWTKNGVYSARSVYMVLAGLGRFNWGYPKIWKCKAPKKVKMFALFLIRGKNLTHDVMQRRGLNCDMECVLCDNCAYETALHLFFHCPYARRVWANIEAMIGEKVVVFGDTMPLTWDLSVDWICTDRKLGKLRWTTMFMCVCWFIWKQQNERIFREGRREAWLLADRAIQEYFLWERYCCGELVSCMIAVFFP